MKKESKQLLAVLVLGFIPILVGMMWKFTTTSFRYGKGIVVILLEG